MNNAWWDTNDLMHSKRGLHFNFVYKNLLEMNISGWQPKKNDWLNMPSIQEIINIRSFMRTTCQNSGRTDD